MILFSKDVACGNSADKTDERGVSVVRLGRSPTLEHSCGALVAPELGKLPPGPQAVPCWLFWSVGHICPALLDIY